MIKRFACLVLAGLMMLIWNMPSAAIAAAECYTPDQYRAEQALRFHTNLMIMGLYCNKAIQQDAYATYQEFTRRNQNIIKSEENRLIGYFRTNKAIKKSPERQLHTMRTDIANEISLRAGQETRAFCAQYFDYYQQAKTMIPADFKRWIERISLSVPAESSLPLCKTAKRDR